jgi:predicted RNase H-like nuclease
MNFLGIDLAWGDKNESGCVAIDGRGLVTSADWTLTLNETVTWIAENTSEDTLLFVDAPLVVNNQEGQRACEKEVGQVFGRFKVSANSTNLSSPRLAGVGLAAELLQAGWAYSDGLDGPPSSGIWFSECYPYATLVGARDAFGYRDRPRYKRAPKGMAIAKFRPLRNAECDGLIRRIAALHDFDPPIDLMSHPTTRTLVESPSPDKSADYKHREDLIDAAICAWSAAYWHRYGRSQCAVFGSTSDEDRLENHLATILAPHDWADQSDPLSRNGSRSL